MSYFNGITDAELKEEGWTPEQIKELRRVEFATQEKKAAKKEKDLADNMAALNATGAKTFAMLTSGPFPSDPHFAAWAARGSQEALASTPKRSPEDMAREVARMDRKWWQFWKA